MIPQVQKTEFLLRRMNLSAGRAKCGELTAGVAKKLGFSVEGEASLST